MARKKAAEAEVVEEIQEVVETPEVATEEVVEAKPKRGRKKKVEAPVEESHAEEPVAEIPVVEVPVEEPAPVEEPTPVEEVKPAKVKKEKKEKKVEAPKEAPVAKADEAYYVVAKANLYVLRMPGVLTSKIGTYKLGTKFQILKECKGWGKIAEGKWINLNYVEKL